LAGWLERAAPWLQPLLYKAMYRHTQEFARGTLEHMIKPESRSAAKDMLLELRSVLTDWQGVGQRQTAAPMQNLVVFSCSQGILTKDAARISFVDSVFRYVMK
jgi:hypothetical protein